MARRRGVMVGVVLVAGALVGCRPTYDHVVVAEGVEDFAISPDGSTVAFSTHAALVGQDRNGLMDVYVRALPDGEPVLVSTDATGADATNGTSSEPAFSPDGRRVAFTTTGSNLGPVDDNGLTDVYVKRVTRGRARATLASARATGAGAGSAGSWAATFAGNGSVVFESVAADLGPTDTNGATDLYVRSLARRSTRLVSIAGTGADAGNGASWGAVVSADGTRLAFQSAASDLGPTDTNGAFDLYLRDLAADTTSLVSVDATGADSASGRTRSPAISPDGTKVAFLSYGSDLGPTDTNGVDDVYLRDLDAGVTTLVSVNAAGTDSGNRGAQGVPAISADGAQVAFVSFASNLGPPDRPTDDPIDGRDVYVRDLVAGTTTMASVNAAGTSGGNLSSFDPVFSPDGRAVAFVSVADDLGPPDGNDCSVRPGTSDPCWDAYVRFLDDGVTSLVSAQDGNSLRRARSSSPAFVGDASHLLFESLSFDDFQASLRFATKVTPPSG